MTTIKASVVLLVFAVTLFVPRSACADAFVVPWVGGNASGQNGAGLVDLGVSLGATAAGIVDMDVDIGYSPEYFGNGFNGSALTMMGDVTFGLPFGWGDRPGFRPYLVGGLGLIRSHVENVSFGYRANRDDLGASYGGGLTVYPTHHVGVRADLRRVQSFDDTAGVRYWRTSIGLVIR